MASLPAAVGHPKMKRMKNQRAFRCQQMNVGGWYIFAGSQYLIGGLEHDFYFSIQLVMIMEN